MHTSRSQGVKDQRAFTLLPSDHRSLGPEVLWLKGPEDQRFVGRELLPCTPIHRGVASDCRVAQGQMERLIDRFVKASISEVSAKQVCTTVD